MCMQSISNNINLLDEYYKKMQQTTLFFVYGEKGLGKSYAIRKFINNHSKIKTLHITSNSFSDFYLEPIEHAILRISSLVDNNESHNNLTYNENTMKKLINFCINNDCILYFENIHLFDEKLILFTKAFINNLLLNYSHLKTFIIIEFDNNDEKTNLDLIRTFYDFFPAEFIKFKRIANEELEIYIHKCFQNNLKINNEDLDYIVDSSFGNIKLCNIIINYLKQEELIVRTTDYWYCKKLKSGILSNVLKNSIQKRYSKLDNTLKNILKQSSLIGFEFDSITLSNTFRILCVEEQLQKIEEISSLISEKDTDNSHYSFENKETFLFTQNQMAKEEKMVWYNTLEKYFYELYLKSIKFNNKENYLIATNHILKAANYALLGEKYQNAFSHFKIALSRCINSMDYEKSLIIINRIEQLSAIISIDDHMMFKILYWKAECFEYIGKYSEARKYYLLCANNYTKTNDYMDMLYHIAYCTYYSSEVENALQQLIHLINYKLSPITYCNVSSMLATIYQEVGEHDKSLSYYEQAINICKKNELTYEYNVQLRKAQVRNDFTHSLTDIKQAIEYFETENDIKELAKAEHNLGLNYLVLGNFRIALQHFFKSIQLFNSFSSIDVLYPYVSLGIYYATYEKDYIKAIEYFEKAIFNEINDYKKLCIYSDLVLCYIKTQNYKLAHSLLNDMENMEARKRNNKIPYYHKTLYFSQAAFFYHIDEKEKALDIYNLSLDMNLTVGQRFFVEKQIEKIRNEKMFNKNSNTMNDNLYRDFDKMDICFTFLKFVE